MRRRNRSPFPQLPTSFLDILFGLVIVFISVSILAYLYINPIAETGNITKKSEFLLTVSWVEGPIDIDTWVLLPSGKTVSFQTKEVELINLERDDKGNNSDTIIVNDEPIMDKTNIEYVTFRAIVPGEYVVSLHVYGGEIFGTNANEFSTNKRVKPEKLLPREGFFQTPIAFKLKFQKLNPKVKLIFETTGGLTFYRQELHIFRFTITPDGEVINLRTDEPIKIINDLAPTDIGNDSGGL